MKKRMLSALLAASMVLTMVPAAFAAEADSAEALKTALELAQTGDTVTVSQNINLGADTVTVKDGVTLNLGTYQLTGTVRAEAGSSIYMRDDETDHYIIDENSLSITEGAAEITFTEKGTTTTIPENTKAEVVGTFMDLGDGSDAYRVPKNDVLNVNGSLTVKGGSGSFTGMEVSGKMNVQGEVTVESGALELVKLKSGETYGSMTIAENASVRVCNGATLDAGEYFATGKVAAEAGATIIVNTDEKIISDETLSVTNGAATVEFGVEDYTGLYEGETGVELTIPEETTAEVVGNFMSESSYRLPKMDRLVVEGQLSVTGKLETVGKLDVPGELIVETGGELQLKKMASHVDTVRMDARNGSVVVKSGATLDVGAYYAQGTVTAEAGATVQVQDDDTTHKIISNETMKVTNGAAQVVFGENTEIVIPTETSAEVVGTFMDLGDNNDAYRVSKADTLTVQGSLTVKGNDDSFTGMEVAGKMNVQGEVTVESGALELVKLKSGENKGSMTIAENASVLVCDDATLDITEGNLSGSGAIYQMANANFNGSVEGSGVDLVTNAVQHTVMFNANGGMFADSQTEKTLTTGYNGKLTSAQVETLGEPTYEGYTFEGWALEDGTKCEPSVYTFTADTKVLAVWEEVTEGPGEDEGYTITFDANGGAFENGAKAKELTTDPDGKLTVTQVETLGKPTYEGYTFEGWALQDYVSATEPSIYTFEKDTAVLAVWNRNGGSTGGGGGGGAATGTYSVSVATAQHGSVSVSPKNASKGDTVTITATPDKGYELDSLTVTDANGKTVTLTEIGDGKYTFTMPDSRVTVKTTFVEIGEKPAELPFGDVSDSAWYAEAVRYVYENGMMNGISANSFGPNATTNRAMIVTILYRLENTPAASSSNFTDVAAGSYYADAVNWAAANGIVNGVSATSFAPNTAVTREQMAAILYRYAKFKGYDVTASNSLSGYADASQISSFAVAAMQWANAEGLITGITSTTLNPAGNATRAEVATILMRFCETVAK